MALNRNVPARNALYQNVQFLRKKITFGNFGTTVTVGTLPAYANVIGGGVHVTTAFNSSGTDLLDVGFIGSTTDPDAYATLLTLAAVGFIPLDELGTTTNIMQTVDTTVTCAPAQSVADATAGEAYVIIMYVMAN
ncbi:hypothetical protein [Mesorhizobium ciceri]|uniref:hypothetical protein n=1 Tax=Mesorhizobium TaxID=68287 RepID=UPI00047D4B06|nr:hypothetical protein [Mesorhizobium ciceri]